MGQARISLLPPPRHEGTLATRLAYGNATCAPLPRVSSTRPAFQLRRAAIRPPIPAARRAHSPPPPARLANAAGRCLTCRSTGASTACRPGREALFAHLPPRGQGAMPFRPGYLYVRQHMGSGTRLVASSSSARRHSCLPSRALPPHLLASAASQFHAARLPASPCSHPAALARCAAGSLSSTIYSLGHPRSALPNLSVNRSANGWPPCPRAARCLSCASRARRPPVVARLPLR
jgi:hypothetical protein